jgi:hypothetical protein
LWRPIIQYRLRRTPRGDHWWQHEQRHDDVDNGPRQPIGEHECKRAAHQQRYAVTEHEHRGARTHLTIFEHVGAVGINRHILGGTEKRNQKRVDAQEAQPGAGIVKGHRRDGYEQRHLHDENPSAAASKDGWDVAVNERSPRPFERVRQCDQTEQTNGGQVDILDRQPSLEHVVGQNEWQAG